MKSGTPFLEIDGVDSAPSLTWPRWTLENSSQISFRYDGNVYQVDDSRSFRTNLECRSRKLMSGLSSDWHVDQAVEQR